jgi:hypothetical protein
MAVTVKQKVKEFGGKVATTLSDFAEDIDKLGAVQQDAEKVMARIKALTNDLAAYKIAMKGLQERITLAYDEADADPDAEGVEQGVEYLCEVGKKGNSRKITDIKQLRKVMGDETFFKVASVTLKDIDAYLTPDQVSKVLTTDRTARGIKIEKRKA